MIRRLLRLEWDAIAGIVAAVAALVLHFLQIIDTDVLAMITLVLIALIFLRLLRFEQRSERLAGRVDHGTQLITELVERTRPPDVLVIGPRDLRRATTSFARGAHGDMVWFNVCLSMFVPQPLFDALLRPAVENPNVASITFVLDERQRSRWERDVWPKIVACGGTTRVSRPTWTDLGEDLSFILADGPTGTTECLLSFWGEPFMSRHIGRDIPRYIFHVKGHSDLVERFIELGRTHRIAGAT